MRLRLHQFSCTPVGPYPAQFAFTGVIERIEIDLWPQLAPDDRDAFEDGQLRGAIAQR